MLIINDLRELPGTSRHPVLSIGAFDGIHLGHQAILNRLIALAKEKGGTSVVLTFDPHPQRIITPATAPHLLQTREQKEGILREMGVDYLFRLPFSREMSMLSPERFVNDVLFPWNVQNIVVGCNFRFGHKRAGDFQMLEQLCAARGIRVHGIQPVRFRGIRVSSTRIRAHLLEGHVALARRMLGRPYHTEGTVVRGAGNGLVIGFPTANIEPENELTPGVGVYAGRASVAGEKCICVINIGYRPTVHRRREGAPVLEAHLLDFSGDLYGTGISLEFWVRLRGERKFESVEMLKKQIAKDIRLTRKYVARTRGLSAEER